MKPDGTRNQEYTGQAMQVGKYAPGAQFSGAADTNNDTGAVGVGRSDSESDTL